MSATPITPDQLRRLGVAPGPVDTVAAPPLSSAISLPAISQYKDNLADTSVAPALGMNIAMPNPRPSPGLPIGPSVTPAPTQTQRDITELNRRKDTGSGIDQINNPLLRGIARAADIVGSVFAPNLAQFIPGTTLHHQLTLNEQEQKVATDQSEDQKAAQTADQLAQTSQRQALGDKASAQADAFTPVTITKDLAAGAGTPELEGAQMTMHDYRQLVANKHNNDAKVATNAATNDAKRDTTDATVAGRAANVAATNTARESISDAANKTRTLLGQMHDATSRANNANTNDHKAGSGVPGADGSFKVPADVTKRGALAGNVTENADAVDSLIKARPDIVGAAGGRYSTVQQMIGSDDPAIAELGVRMHNIALASNGAHGVRAAGAIEQTENELFNHFKSGPTAIHAALQATRGSMQTFLDDEKNFSTTGKRTGGTSTPAAPGAEVWERDASGKLVKK